MKFGLVFVKTVEHDLSRALGLVGQLHLGEGDGLPLPVGPEVGAVWMHVHRVLGGGLGLAPGQPLPVDVLPPVVLDLLELQEDSVHGAGVESGYPSLGIERIFDLKSDFPKTMLDTVAINWTAFNSRCFQLINCEFS